MFAVAYVLKSIFRCFYDITVQDIVYQVRHGSCLLVLTLYCSRTVRHHSLRNDVDLVMIDDCKNVFTLPVTVLVLLCVNTDVPFITTVCLLLGYGPNFGHNTVFNIITYAHTLCFD